MTTRADIRPDQDMSFWLADKADNAIKEITQIIDILKRIKQQIPPSEREQLDFWLRTLLSHEIAISGLGHENWNFDQGKWIGLLSKEGSLRVDEFRRMITSVDSENYEPSMLPERFETLISDIRSVRTGLTNTVMEHSQIRQTILDLAHRIEQINLLSCKPARERLLKLVDQSTGTEIPLLEWNDFIQETSDYIAQLEQRISSEVQETLQPLN